jgi:hypothetical protein
MVIVKQFSLRASLPHVLAHVLLITILAINMVMSLPA